MEELLKYQQAFTTNKATFFGTMLFLISGGGHKRATQQRSCFRINIWMGFFVEPKYSLGLKASRADINIWPLSVFFVAFFALLRFTKDNQLLKFAEKVNNPRAQTFFKELAGNKKKSSRASSWKLS